MCIKMESIKAGRWEMTWQIKMNKTGINRLEIYWINPQERVVWMWWNSRLVAVKWARFPPVQSSRGGAITVLGLVLAVECGSEKLMHFHCTAFSLHLLHWAARLICIKCISVGSYLDFHVDNLSSGIILRVKMHKRCKQGPTVATVDWMACDWSWSCLIFME